MPVNFSRTDFGPTHIMSAEAILAMTLVTYPNNQDQNKIYLFLKGHSWVLLNINKKLTRAMTTQPGSGTAP